MGSTLSTMSSSSFNPSSRKASADSLDLKPSLFQRSKATLNRRSKKSSLSSLSHSTSSNPHVVPSSSQNASASASASSSRHTSLDSLEGRSDHSVGIRSLAPPLQRPLYIPPGDSQQPLKQHPHQLEGPDSQNSSLVGVMPSGSLPEWAHHSRKCEDGRTRHTVESAPYMLPNDLTESDRLDAQHYLVRFIFKGNYNVKLDPEAPLKILDVATGTGVWALEMAHEFPKAEVYGVDISSIFPTEIKPNNCHFQLCNILDGLPFPDNTFDFIYQRLLVYALTPAQRKQVYSELMRVLKPEGYLQLVESDGIVYNPGPEMEKINQLSLETSLRHGVDPREVQVMKSGLKHTGYTGVNSFNIALPVGDWGGKAGALSRQNMHGLATIWLKGEVGRMDQVAVDTMLAKVDQECEQFQSYYKVWLVVGAKPTVAAMLAKEAKKAAAAALATKSGASVVCSAPAPSAAPSLVPTQGRRSPSEV